MRTIFTVSAGKRRQFLVLAGVSFLATGLSGLLFFTAPETFQRFFGPVNPILVAALATLLGFVFLSFLSNIGWAAIYRPGEYRRGKQPVLITAALALLMILIDRTIVFPRDINVPFPEALAFYPAIAFIVEVFFHVVPLTILLFLLRSVWNPGRQREIVWTGVVLTALLEPVYQVIPMQGHYPGWAVLYVGVHLFVFNLVQLRAFIRHDFLTMFMLRLVYYLIWHILWGYFRLELLF
ncbi:MAG: hypothetical protein EP344_01550 [Bacteroidetes bacterium]|nr:MAG: hypothetical protein EP344_01550 [Bacteroidota bacterium]